MAKAKKVVKRKNQWLMLVISFSVFLLFCVIGGYFSLLYAGEQMIDLKQLEGLKAEPSVVYDKNGKEIGKLYIKEERTYVPITKIPTYLIDAFVAVEDKRFFEHNGVDPVRIVGAIFKDIQAGAAVEGGSTLTQQLAKNVFLSQEKTFWRKTKEMSIAIGLENKYSKQQIMEMYLNQVYLGHGMAGVESAAKYYFDKSFLNDKEPLTIAEAATLAAIPKAPSYYSPFADPERAKERRDTILRLMYEQKYITLAQKEAAQKEPLPKEKDNDDPGMNKGYQAYMDYVIQEAKEKYQIDEDTIYRGGWKIHTSFDRNMQDAMISAFNKESNFPQNGKTKQVEASMIVVDPKTGGIAGMMGGRNYKAKGYNLATDMRRQPGSTFKPLAVYAPALDMEKVTINSELNNQRQSFNGYKPRNYDGRYSDHISIKQAVTKSTNIPAVWLLNEIGIGNSLDYIDKFGIKLDKEDRNLAIALGGLHSGTSPLHMAQAYTAFPNAGVMSEAHAILKLEEPTIGYSKTADIEQTSVIKPQTAWGMHKLLTGVVEDGTGKAAAAAGRPVAGKTGSTTSEVNSSSAYNKDVWFVGYTPEYVGAVWMGFDKEDTNNVMKGGSSFPAKLFGNVMKQGLKGVKVKEFDPPEGVAQQQEPEQPSAALQLAADLTMDANQMKVVLSWIGGDDKAKSYDVYRFVDNIDAKELLAGGLTDTTFVDTLTESLPYQYVVVSRDAEGNEITQSNVAQINTTQLENLLKDGQNQDNQGTPADGNTPEDGDQNGDNPPVDGGNGEPTDGNGQPTDGNGQPTDGSGQPTDGNGGPSDGSGQPTDGQNPPPVIEPPVDGGGDQPPVDGDQPDSTESHRKKHKS